MRGYSLPRKSNTTTMINKNPMPLLGPYPQDLLWGQVGIIPTSANTKMMSKIVPSDMITASLYK